MVWVKIDQKPHLVDLAMKLLIIHSCHNPKDAKPHLSMAK